MKKNNKKGFTLAELLVVVAIIAVLVAISIPVFTSQLDKARAATNQANVRSAKAVAEADYLDEEYTDDMFYAYDVDEATVTTCTAVSASAITKDDLSENGSVLDYVYVWVSSDGSIKSKPALSEIDKENVIPTITTGTGLGDGFGI